MGDSQSLVFLAVVLVAVVEMIMAWRWYRPYFEYGIPVFRTSVKAPTSSTLTPEPGRLEYECQKRFKAPFSFRKLGPASYGFREKHTSALSLRLHYTPIMHGSLRFEPSSATLVVTGYLNWFAVVFTLFMTYTVLNDGAAFFLAALAAGVSFIYLVQRHYYRQVAEAAAAAWVHSVEAHSRGV
jgi:hypothetical protein